ncbi:MAG: Rrf2 family transcriptional regulator [bacterium]|nr:Rrf2 family transcriptional regulator [bacterium]
MVISRASESAVRALLYMASLPSGQVAKKQDICRTQEITPAFFIKIMQPLLSAGLVESYRGVAGGFSLRKPPEKISLWDIVSAVEGPIYLNKCMIHKGYCSRDAVCQVHKVWHNAKKAVQQILADATLDKLVR